MTVYWSFTWLVRSIEGKSIKIGLGESVSSKVRVDLYDRASSLLLGESNLNGYSCLRGG